MTDQQFALWVQSGKAIDSQVDVMLDGRSGRTRGCLVSVCINEYANGCLIADCEVVDADGKQWSADHRHLERVTP